MSLSRPGVAVIAHSGGPTAVINASLLGVVEEARRHSQITALYGSRFGVAGILNEDFIDLYAQSPDLIGRVAHTPSSALGSSRHELTEADFDRLIAVLRAHNVRYFFYNGGNGSMGTADRIARLCSDRKFEIQIVGIPKTIDNDLMATDHSPGYASTARFFACAARDIGAENLALPGQVEILEVLGRNTGWIAAATALARQRPGDAPHLIYFPEEPLPLSRFLSDVEDVYRRLNRCVVCVCEGQLDEHGEVFGADTRSGSRGKLAMNLAHRLALLITQHLKIRARSEKPGLLGRSTSLTIVPRDWDEARLCGTAAVRAAVAGDGGSMITLDRRPGPDYRIATGLAPLSRVAFIERPFPVEWRSNGHLAQPFFEYVAPLAGEIAGFPALDPAVIAKMTPGGTR